MNRAPAVTAMLALTLAAALSAQESPKPQSDTVRADTARGAAAQAGPRLLPPGVQLGYRRTPFTGLDPFRHVIVPHWGFILGAGGGVDNNSVNLQDIGAFMKLGKDSITAGSVIDALGLVPRGQGLQGLARGDGGVYLGTQWSGRVTLGFSAGGRGYGSFLVDDSAVALLRDGNGARQNFAVGQTHGAALATAEGGAHVLIRLGAIHDEAGLRIILGGGARYLKPLFYARSGSAVTSPGTIRLTGDSIAANVSLTTDQALGALMKVKGSGLVTDFLLRFELPEPGIALEAMLVNVGTLKLQQVEQRLRTFNVSTTSFKIVNDSLNASKARVLDTAAVTVQMPQQLRFALNAWVLPMLQLDAAYTTQVTGDFATPAMVEAGATLRLISWLPLRVGILSDGGLGSGLTGGFAIESRALYLHVDGASLGGSFKSARGASGRLEFGFFF